MKGILLSGALAFLFALFATPLAIKLLVKKSYGQFIRDDGPTTHHTKRGTPTMGGTVITMGYKSKGSFNLCSKKESYINLENYIIDSYKSSKHHDLAMVNPEAHQVGISIFREEIKEGSNIKYKVFCVITFGS